MNQKLSGLSGGSGGHLIGQPVKTYSGVEYMADKGYLPMEGGIVGIEDFPELHDQIGQKFLTIAGDTPGPNWPFNDSNIQTVWVSDGDLILYGNQSSSYYGGVIDANTLQRLSYFGFSYAPTAFQICPSRTVYFGNTEGNIFQKLPPNYNTGATLSAGSMGITGTSGKDIVGIYEYDGYLFVASSYTGIYRCSLSDSLTVAANWQLVHARYLGSLNNTAQEVAVKQFFEINGRLFFKHGGLFIYTENAGETWTSITGGAAATGLTEPVEWQGAFWMFERNSPTLATPANLTAANCRVFRSIDEGRTWELHMLMPCLGKKLVPFVYHGMLIHAVEMGNGRPQIRALLKDKPGMEVLNIAVGNEDYLIRLGEFPSGRPFAFPQGDFIRYFSATLSTSTIAYQSSRLTYDPSAYFRLPSEVTFPRTYIKAK